jgi:glycerophosphoryl diester phosphodiesterase
MTFRPKRLCAHLAALVATTLALPALASSAADIYANAVLADNPLSYWKLDAAGPLLDGSDASGNGFDAAVLGSAASLTQGLFGSAAAGMGSYLQVPELTALNGSNAVTVEAWVRLDAPLGSIGDSFAGIYDSSQDNFVMYLDRGNGELRFKVTTANNYAERPGASAYIVNKKQGEWLHVVGMLDPNDTAGASAKIYVDGVLRDRHTAVALDSTVRAGQLAAIGGDWNNGSPFRLLDTGYVDQVAVYGQALSEAQIRAHYELGSGKTFSQSQPRITGMAEGFEVIAHRGNSMFAPENTLESDRQAIALGADRFETDVRLTADGVAVISHDDNTSRATGVSRSIANSTLADLQGLSAGMASKFGDRYAGEAIPTLHDTLALARDADTKVVLDVKVNNAGAAIAAELLATGYDARKVVAFGWNDTAVADLVSHLGEAEVFHLGFFGSFASAGSFEARMDVLDSLKLAGVDGLALSFADLLSGGEPLWGDLLAIAADRQLRVFTWTVDEAETMADLISLRAERQIDGRLVVGQLSGIITDDPATAVALVSAVPEPETWAMMLVGTLVMLVRRRRAV